MLCAGVAQLVEQLIRNQQVVGSSPIASSTHKGTNKSSFLFFHTGNRTDDLFLPNHVSPRDTIRNLLLVGRTRQVTQCCNRVVEK